MKHIIIVNLFGIGDVLFSTPLVRALKKEFPEARIDYMCNRRCECILQNNENIENVIVFEKDEFRTEFRNSKIAFIKKVGDLIKIIKKGK